ncbi:MAG: DNA N-6-adenine-methyltransferase [Acidimicrobiales bacterium]
MSARLAGIAWGPLVSSRSDEWLTPPAILDALGPFDLDPCTPVEMPWRTAGARYSVADDGLGLPWSGRVWLNPPYSDAGAWMSRLAGHGCGTALVFARTDTAWWFASVWGRADLALFLRGRVSFYDATGRPSRAGHATSPSVLVAYGEGDAASLESAVSRGDLCGQLVDPSRGR